MVLLTEQDFATLSPAVGVALYAILFNRANLVSLTVLEALFSRLSIRQGALRLRVGVVLAIIEWLPNATRPPLIRPLDRQLVSTLASIESRIAAFLERFIAEGGADADWAVDACDCLLKYVAVHAGDGLTSKTLAAEAMLISLIRFVDHVRACTCRIGLNLELVTKLEPRSALALTHLLYRNNAFRQLDNHADLIPATAALHILHNLVLEHAKTEDSLVAFQFTWSFGGKGYVFIGRRVLFTSYEHALQLACDRRRVTITPRDVEEDIDGWGTGTADDDEETSIELKVRVKTSTLIAQIEVGPAGQGARQTLRRFFSER